MSAGVTPSWCCARPARATFHTKAQPPSASQLRLMTVEGIRIIRSAPFLMLAHIQHCASLSSAHAQFMEHCPVLGHIGDYSAQPNVAQSIAAKSSRPEALKN